MTKTAFDKIAAGLSDAIGFAQGDTARGRGHGIDAKAIREKTKLSQSRFAETFHLPVSTVRDWEQDRRVPDAPARALLSMIEADPDGARKLMAKARPTYSAEKHVRDIYGSVVGGGADLDDDVRSALSTGVKPLPAGMAEAIMGTGKVR